MHAIEALGDVPHSVLLTTVHSLDDSPHFLASAVAVAAAKTTEALRIVVVSPLFNPPSLSAPAGAASLDTGPSHDDVPAHSHTPGISRTAHWDAVQRLLTFVYVQATKVAQDADRVLLDVDVLLRGIAEPFPESVLDGAPRVFMVTPHDTPTPTLPASLESRRSEIVVLPPDDQPVHPSPRSPTAPPPTDGEGEGGEGADLPPLFRVVALGGTFDHLHAGHKILLSMGAWIASEKLIVGITDDALLVKKAYKEALEPLAVRTARTRAFLERVRPGIAHALVPLNDVYGPTGWDPDVQGLVVSRETLPGASSIATRRRELGLPPLRTFVIDVISATEASVDAEDAAALRTAKMSSTYIREWLVRRRPELLERDREGARS